MKLSLLRRRLACLLVIFGAGIPILLFSWAGNPHHYLADDNLDTADVSLETEGDETFLPINVTEAGDPAYASWLRNCGMGMITPTPPKNIRKDRKVSKKAAVSARQPFNKTHIMFMDGVGRLGNKMFQYAGLTGIAYRLGYMPYIRANDYLLKIFQIRNTLPDIPSGFYMFGEAKAGGYDPCLESLPRDRNWTLIGYYQSWKYFQNVPAVIRKAFRFKQVITDKVKTLLEERKVTNRTKIGVHVRRGDMNALSSRKRGYTVATVDFFRRAMDYFRVKYRDCVFLICSDDMKWAEKTLKSEDTLFVQINREIDFAVLASCDHNIVSTGSYGWWAAWLAGGNTVYYKNFPQKDSWLAGQYEKEDYFPAAWKGME